MGGVVELKPILVLALAALLALGSVSAACIGDTCLYACTPPDGTQGTCGVGFKCVEAGPCCEANLIREDTMCIPDTTPHSPNPNCAGDINGDGFADFVVGASDLNVFGDAYSWLGASADPAGSPDWQDSGQYGYGHKAAVGDVNGDNYLDVVVADEQNNAFFPAQGTVNVYYGSGTGLSGTADEVMNVTSSVTFGEGVALGDVNADGYDDLLVGGSTMTHTGTGLSGSVLYYPGSAGGFGDPAWAFDETNISMGYMVEDMATADLNDDGYADLIVGCDLCWVDGVQTGVVDVFYGGAGGFAATPNVRLDGTEGGALFGFSVASAGDIDGDGIEDLVVGEPQYDGAGVDRGRVLVYTGSGSGITTTPFWTYGPLSMDDELRGIFARGAGDVNGDGLDDLAISTAGSANGLIEVFYSPLGGGPDTTFGVVDGGDVSGVGDVNGDGYDDLLAGDLASETVYLYYGGPTGLIGPNWSYAPGVGEGFGRDIAAAWYCPVPATGEICNDGIDNDADLKIDCADEDCWGWPGVLGDVPKSSVGFSWASPANATSANATYASLTANFTPVNSTVYYSNLKESEMVVPGVLYDCYPLSGSEGECRIQGTDTLRVLENVTNVLAGIDAYSSGASHCGDTVCGIPDTCQDICTPAPLTYTNVSSTWRWIETDACPVCDATADGDADGYFNDGRCGQVDCDDANGTIHTNFECTDPGTCNATTYCLASAAECPTIPLNETSCTDGVDEDCDGYTDCSDSDCDAEPQCEPDNNVTRCGSLGFNWTGNGGSLNCCGDDWGEGRPSEGTFEWTETLCADGLDNDCNGELDWDSDDRNLSDPFDARGIKGDPNCPVSILNLNSIATPALCPGEVFGFYCEANAEDLNSVYATMTHGECFPQPSRPGNPADHGFGCIVDEGYNGPDTIVCQINTTRSYETPPTTATRAVTADGTLGRCQFCGNGRIDVIQVIDVSGNMYINYSEECDPGGTSGFPPPDMPNVQCSDYPDFSGGDMNCTRACQLDTSGCVPDTTSEYCGDGIVNNQNASLPEACEPPLSSIAEPPSCDDFTGFRKDNAANIVYCDQVCQYNLSDCCYDPDGDGWGPNCGPGGSQNFDCNQSNAQIWGRENKTFGPNPNSCSDGLDNDCDGEVDWDTQDWNLGDGLDTKDIHGDDGCAIDLNFCLRDPDPLYANKTFTVECHLADGFDTNSIQAVPSGSGSCVYDEWLGAHVDFNCTFPSVQAESVTCTVDGAKSYQDGPDEICNMNIQLSPCSSYGDNAPGTGCEANGCCWITNVCEDIDSGAPGTSNRTIMGGSANVCIDCPEQWVCRQGICGAESDATNGCPGVNETYNATTCSCEEVTYCGDGIIQTPNWYGAVEECDPGLPSPLNGTCLGNCTVECDVAFEWNGTHCRPEFETNCNNNLDDDFDGYVDEHDEDCPIILALIPDVNNSIPLQNVLASFGAADGNLYWDLDPAKQWSLCDWQGCNPAGNCVGTQFCQNRPFISTSCTLNDPTIDKSGIFEYTLCYINNSDPAWYQSVPSHCAANFSHRPPPGTGPGDDNKTDPQPYLHEWIWGTSSWLSTNCSAIITPGCGFPDATNLTYINESEMPQHCTGHNVTAACVDNPAASTYLAGTICEPGIECTMAPGTCSAYQCHKRNDADVWEWAIPPLIPETNCTDTADNDCDGTVNNCVATVANVSGYVLDASDNPIEDAFVQIIHPPTGNTTQTPLSGYYEFGNVPVGNHYLTAQKPGYRSNTTNITFLAGVSYEQNFTLTNGSCVECLNFEDRCDLACEGTDQCAPYHATIAPACQGRKPGTWVSYNSSHFVLCCGEEVFKRKILSNYDVEGCMQDLVPYTRLVRYMGDLVKLTVYVWPPCE